MTKWAVEWDRQDEPTPTCGETKPRGKVRCEMPPDHSDGHAGRGAAGQWLCWPRRDS